MSATNWAICPKCKIENDKTNAKRITDAEKHYGKVSSKKYMALRSEARNSTVFEETLREEYQIYINEDNGKFTVFYHGCCEVCQFEYKYEYTEKVIKISET